MRIIYNFGILVYSLIAKLVAPFNEKARLWTAGRKDWEDQLRSRVTTGTGPLWIHCASLGEFEQGRPVIEMFRKLKPGYRIILTFFSPSGYEIRKNYGNADYVCYLPPDTPGNAEKFISILKPAVVIFVKYEFWNNYISILSQKKIPLYLISAIFMREQPFFRWYGGFFKRMLFRFNHIFVQDQESENLLRGIGVDQVSVAGDTRFDRVVEIAGSASDIPLIEEFRGADKLLLAGSSWHQDEEIIAHYINMNPGKMKWIFAPHEIDEPNIERLEKLFSVKTVRFSEFNKGSDGAQVMIIDNIGMLSSAYRYAFIAAIGGGFGKGIHNVLEAACWGVPVVFGPNYTKFREATDLLSRGGARCFSTFDEFSRIIDTWLSDSKLYSTSANAAGGYVKENTGATARILSVITVKDINT